MWSNQLTRIAIGGTIGSSIDMAICVRGTICIEGDAIGGVFFNWGTHGEPIAGQRDRRRFKEVNG